MAWTLAKHFCADATFRNKKIAIHHKYMYFSTKRYLKLKKMHMKEVYLHTSALWQVQSNYIFLVIAKQNIMKIHMRYML
jgi:hypothetical protein